MLRTYLMDRSGEVRTHWRIALAVVLLGLCITAALLVAAATGWTADFGLRSAGVAGALCATWVLTRFVNKKPITAVGVGVVPNPLPELLGGLALGIGAILLISVVLWLSGFVTFSWRDLPAEGVVRIACSAFAGILVGAAAEELVFRGYLFQTLIQGITLLPASLVMSGFFAMAHGWNPAFSVLGAFNVGLAGLLFSVAYAKTGRLWLPLGIHGGWNFAQLTLAGYPESGLIDHNRMLCTAAVSGPEWWTGGAFGPEGGLTATVALLGCAWFVLRSERFSRPAGLITLDSPEDLLATGKN